MASCSQSKNACLGRSHEGLCFANGHGVYWPKASLPLYGSPMPAFSWVCQLFDAQAGSGCAERPLQGEWCSLVLHGSHCDPEAAGRSSMTS